MHDCVCKYMPWYKHTGQRTLLGVSSLLLPHGSWDSTTQIWWQVPFPAEPSCQTHVSCLHNTYMTHFALVKTIVRSDSSVTSGLQVREVSSSQRGQPQAAGGGRSRIFKPRQSGWGHLHQTLDAVVGSDACKGTSFSFHLSASRAHWGEHLHRAAGTALCVSHRGSSDSVKQEGIPL